MAPDATLETVEALIAIAGWAGLLLFFVGGTRQQLASLHERQLSNIDDIARLTALTMEMKGRFDSLQCNNCGSSLAGMRDPRSRTRDTDRPT